MRLSTLAATAAGSLVLLGALPAAAATVVYNATLLGANESPAVASPAIGFSIVTLDTTSFTMRVQSIFTGLVGATTASHIHCCTVAPGTGNAGVATTTPTFTGFPLGVSAGTYDMTFDMQLASSYNPSFIAANGGTPASAFAALASGMAAGLTYMNIHSSFAPGGEIRGTLLAAVPEPGSYALMLGGLAALGWVTRRKGGAHLS